MVSPLVRKLAQEHGIALSGIRGSGAGGLILRSDVELAIVPEPAPAQPQRQAGKPGEEVAGVVDQRTGLPVLARTPLSGMKKAAAAALVRSRREIPDATVWVDVDATALLELRPGCWRLWHGLWWRGWAVSRS